MGKAGIDRNRWTTEYTHRKTFWLLLLRRKDVFTTDFWTYRLLERLFTKDFSYGILITVIKVTLTTIDVIITINYVYFYGDNRKYFPRTEYATAFLDVFTGRIFHLISSIDGRGTLKCGLDWEWMRVVHVD